jgi:hypothetical protein
MMQAEDISTITVVLQKLDLQLVISRPGAAKIEIKRPTLE